MSYHLFSFCGSVQYYKIVKMLFALWTTLLPCVILFYSKNSVWVMDNCEFCEETNFKIFIVAIWEFEQVWKSTDVAYLVRQ
jgi:hypothetical protein